LLTYWTAWVDKADELSFRPDIYKQDAEWLAQLRKPMAVRGLSPAAIGQSRQAPGTTLSAGTAGR
jgi:hypothetical protein